MSREVGLISCKEVGEKLGIGKRKLLALEMEPGFPNRETTKDGEPYWCEIDIQAYLQRIRKHLGIEDPAKIKKDYMDANYSNLRDPVAIQMLSSIDICYWRERGDKRLEISPDRLSRALHDVYEERGKQYLKEVAIIAEFAKKHTVDYSFLWSAFKASVQYQKDGQSLEESIDATIGDFINKIGGDIKKGACN